MSEPHPPSKITRDDVAHVAHLARLTLTEDELDRFTDQLAAVLDHASDVEALEIDDVPPTARSFPLVNVMRPDEVGPTLEPGEVLSQAPAAEADQFRVPPILGEAP
jgi:aspartyl-tRNA(Asn)/glutamyl-tRNA(Gln) amidotransferase subunit C